MTLSSETGAYRRRDGTFPDRDGTSPLERRALQQVERNLAAMRASLVVQLALWPVELRSIAEQSGRSPAMLYNTLSRNNHRPYHAVRAVLADALDRIARLHHLPIPEITKAAVDHLIDAPTAEAQGLAATTRDLDVDGSGSPESPVLGSGASSTVRDGMNAIETMALLRTQNNVAAFSASEVIQLVLWPGSIEAWAEEAGHEAGNTYNMLAFRNGFAYGPIRRAFAASLRVSEDALGWLIEAQRAHPPLAGGLEVPHPSPRRRTTGPRVIQPRLL